VGTNSLNVPQILLKSYDINDGAYAPSFAVPKIKLNYGIARADSQIVIAGGEENGDPTNSVDIYSNRTGVWRRLEFPNLSIARTNCSALIFNNKLFVAGGRQGSAGCLASVEYLDILSAFGAWKQTRPLNFPRADGVLIEYKGFMFKKKKKNNTGYETRIEVYDEINDCWLYYGDMLEGRSKFGATVFEDRIYILGGTQKSLSVAMTTMKDVMSYHVGSNQWRREPKSLSSPRSTPLRTNFSSESPTLITVQKEGRDHHIVVIHGNDFSGNVHGELEKLEPNSRSRRWVVIKSDTEVTVKEEPAD